VEIANSDFLNGLNYKDATQKAIAKLEIIEQGTGKTNYRLRDAVFSRQRYWGEPFPVYYVNGLPKMIDVQHLPIILPEVEKYLPTEDGLPPLGNAAVWAWDTVSNQVVNTDLVDHETIFPLELNTMPGWAGSSWYWMRYMDAHNEDRFASAEALRYWESVDLYIGGSEHATGHLLYSRFWNKFLKDKGFAPTEEPFKKLINQGMILGTSAFVYRLVVTSVLGGRNEFGQDTVGDNLYGKTTFVSSKYYKEFIKYKRSSNLNSDFNISFSRGSDVIINGERNDILTELSNLLFEKTTNNTTGITIYGDSFDILDINDLHVDVSIVNSSDELDISAFINHPLNSDYEDAEFVLENGKYIVGREVEKMSKSKYNVVTPDDICNEYGADTLRLYEMFLGPLEQAKPWNTAGISGVFSFLKKLWRLYIDENNGLIVNNDEPTKDNLKSLHKTIKKVADDIENFSFNTSVSQFMICVNELSAQNCHSRAVLEPLAILVSPYAPHIAEELWSQLGHTGSISTVAFPVFDAKHLIESSKEYPVSFNGKMRFTIELPLDLTKEQIEEIIMKDERTLKQLDGKTPNKVIIVPGKIINLVG
jgi:leucyl-tRNA synthetase